MVRNGIVAAVVVLLCIVAACTKDSDKIDTKDFPVEIGKIFRGRCATSGCHNSASYKAAGGLELTDWESLFRGSNNGASVIPFRSDFSSLCYFVNTYPDMGIVNLPTMPVGLDPLDRGEVQKIKDWINSGAANLSGEVAFSGDRPKFYVAHTACKVVCVFDAATRVQMRYITVLNPGETCTPHMVRVSPDKQYWYVCFNSNGKYLRKYRTSDDSFVGEAFIGGGEWNSFTITPDSKTAFVVDWTSNGKFVKVNLDSMQLVWSYVYQYMPHGSAVSPDGQNVYFTSTTGNCLYKKPVAANDNSVDFVFLNPADQTPQSNNVYNAHEILFLPDGSKYYVTCQNEHTVRVFDAATDQCTAVIPINGSTLEMAYSPSKNLLFVTSWDANQFPNTVGAVAVINVATNTVQSYINAGTQPHGIAVDEARGVVYVANRNVDASGPLPHHTSVCGGRNGNVVFIDLNSLQLTGRRIEVSVDPYSIGVKE
jgi:YVTN family beta-propeller protein